VHPTDQPGKLADVAALVAETLRDDSDAGVIVYCSTRNGTEELAGFLREKGLGAEAYHAGLPPERKKDLQQAFIAGGLRVITATNAFGMGIDKPNVRLVVHADIPGSLENYLQEAGRAGRDNQAARRVLLYCVDDVERQFGMSARSRLKHGEIQAVLRALRRLDARKRLDGEVVATPGEILQEEEGVGRVPPTWAVTRHLSPRALSCRRRQSSGSRPVDLASSNLSKGPQCLVYRLCGGEYFGNVRIQADKVGPLGTGLRVLATRSRREVILVPHRIGIALRVGFLLHTASSLFRWLAGR